MISKWWETCKTNVFCFSYLNPPVLLRYYWHVTCEFGIYICFEMIIIIFLIVIHYWWIDPFYHYIVTILVFCYHFWLKVYFDQITIDTCGLFLFPFAWNNFFHCSTMYVLKVEARLLEEGYIWALFFKPFIYSAFCLKISRVKDETRLQLRSCPWFAPSRVLSWSSEITL